MVVLASARAPSGARGPGGGIALRVTPEPLAAALVNRFGHPVTSTSANVAGGAPAESAGRIAEIFPVGVAIVIDGGLRPAGLPSTLIDLTADRPRILREGAVDRAAIEAALGEGAP
jgi:tRNA A37 threonylcarbamoyladenosine synthetase subunit TsaC/SUA5/YrdC